LADDKGRICDLLSGIEFAWVLLVRVSLDKEWLDGGFHMKVQDIDMRKMLSFQPESGKLLLGNERYLLFRQEAFGTLRKLLFEQLGGTLARSILSQFGYRCGMGDFEALGKLYAWDTDMDRISAGPVMHCWEGLVRAEPTLLKYDRQSQSFHMQGTWKNSYEAEIHLQQFGPGQESVCHSLTGYASGWTSAFMGFDLIATEPTCVARGDSVCTFDIKPPALWGDEAKTFKEALSSTDYSLSKELESKIETIEYQAKSIRELATPILEVWDDILVLPIVGSLDSERGEELLRNTLSELSQRSARCLIIDVTGVEHVDTLTAGQIVKLVRAAELLGTYAVLTGIRSQIAHTLVGLGLNLGGVRTLRSLKDGLRNCVQFLERKRT